MDIGSSKISMLAGVKQSGKNVVLGQSEVSYEGYMDGEFLTPQNLKMHIQNAVSTLEVSVSSEIKSLTVSVPAEFSYSVTQKVNVTFASLAKITAETLSEVNQSAVEDMSGFIPLSTQPIFYTLSDGKQVINPINHKTLSLSAFVNVIYAKKTFVETLNQIFASIGINSVKYVSGPLVLVQSNFLDLAQKVCVVDVGYLSSTVIVARGKGLENVFSFSLGGGQIEADLMDSFALTLKEAAELKRNIVLSLSTQNAEFYETANLGKTRKILTHNANQVVESRLTELSYIINDCLNKCGAKEDMSIYLTGGGITQIQGAKNFLAKKLERNVEILNPKQLGFNKPFQTSLISLFLSQINA